MATLILTDEQKSTLNVSFVTLAGNPAKVDGTPVWAISDPSIATLNASADGLSAEVISVALGSTQISVSADADLTSEGVKSINGLLDLQLVPAEAATVVIGTSAPVIK